MDSLFGLGLRPPHYLALTAAKHPSVDFLEVISENFMHVGGRPREVLEAARAHYPIALHGVGMSLGSLQPPRQLYLERLRELIGWVEPLFVSDHLCWTGFAGKNTHDLLPMPYTWESLKLFSDHVAYVQDFLGQRFYIENPSAYIAFAHADMDEADFLQELCRRTGCGLIFDLNNLFVNHKNLALDVDAYLQKVAGLDVAYFHLAGHSVAERVRIDTHDHPICDEVWQLYQKAKGIWKKANTLIEWDDHIPELTELVANLDKARRLASASTGAQRIDHEHGTTKPVHLSQTASVAPPFAHTSSTFYHMVTQPNGVESIAEADKQIVSSNSPVPRDIGIRVYNNAYFLRLRDVLKESFPTLGYVLEDFAFDAIVAQYLQHAPPSEESVDMIGAKFADFFMSAALPNIDYGVPAEVLRDIAALEQAHTYLYAHPAADHVISQAAMAEIAPSDWQTVRFGFSKSHTVLTTAFSILPVWKAAETKSPPTVPEKNTSHILVARLAGAVHHRSLSDGQAQFLTLLKQYTFLEACEHFAADPRQGGHPTEEICQTAAGWLVQWCQDGIISAIECH